MFLRDCINIYLQLKYDFLYEIYQSYYNNENIQNIDH